MFHLVAIAASAGGIEALTAVLGQLPSRFPLPIAVVQHLDAAIVSRLASILGRRTKLCVRQAEDGERLMAGTVYVAPPGSHMEIATCDHSASVRLTHSAPLHFVRPSADRLFESAADACGPIVGVVLTGSGSDGAVGARAIKRAGGIVIAQDEASALFGGMPHAAIVTGAVDFVLSIADIAPALIRLTAMAGEQDDEAN